MAKTSLGKVGILPKGEYSSATQYLRLDIVSYNGSSYLCIKDCVGIDVTNKEYWLLIAQKGDKGDIGEKGEKGDAGKDFSIYKTYASISAMESDASNVPEGEFVLIASNVEDEDNAKLYVKGENSFVYLTDLSGATGIKGEKGDKGDKPVNGVDYNTPEEKEEFKNEVVSTATTEVKQNIETIKEEAIQEFNSNASTKTNEYNDNTTTKLQEYNTNANSKVEEYNSNATQKTNTFNENATTQTETFNNNATSKTNDFNSNASTKTDEFNTNYEEKLESINEASTSIEQERVISDGKYARALKTKVEDVEQTQIYAENDEVEELKIKGVELTQSTREGYNLVDFKSPDEIYVSDFNFQNDILTITSSSMGFRQIIYDITNLMLANAGKVLSFWYSNIDFSQGKSPAVQITLTKNDNTKSYTQLLSASLVKSNFNIPDNISEYSSLTLGIFCNNTSESSNASITITKPMLLIGTEEKPYEQYGASPSIDFPSEVQVASEQNITINETNITIPLTNSAIGQYTDTIDRKNSVQNKFIQELTLTGSESDWGREDTSVGARFFKPLQNSIISNTNNPYALCTHFKLSYGGGTYNVVGNLFAIYNAGGTNRIGFGSFTDMSTVEEWKAKLKELYDAGTPVKIYYVSETIDKIPLSEEIKQELNKFKLYDDLNNVFIDKGSLSFKYNKSLSKELEEKDEMIDNLLTRVQALEAAQVNSVGGN